MRACSMDRRYQFDASRRVEERAAMQSSRDQYRKARTVEERGGGDSATVRHP